ncbi:Uncharacterised protein [Salmonella enterica]|nr:Uncharacterised protein [Salmonella enterica]
MGDLGGRVHNKVHFYMFLFLMLVNSVGCDFCFVIVEEECALYVVVFNCHLVYTPDVICI